MATTGGHVGYESWLERDHVMLLDFDPAVVGISSQPSWLFWSAADGRAVSHAPDYFARRNDGTAVVVDCRPAERRGSRDVAKFEATEVGWAFRLLGAADPVAVDVATRTHADGQGGVGGFRETGRVDLLGPCS